MLPRSSVESRLLLDSLARDMTRNGVMLSRRGQAAASIELHLDAKKTLPCASFRTPVV